MQVKKTDLAVWEILLGVKSDQSIRVSSSPSLAKCEVSAWTPLWGWIQRPLWPRASAVPISVLGNGVFGALPSSRGSPGRPCPHSASAQTSSQALLLDLPPPLPPPVLLLSIAYNDMKWIEDAQSCPTLCDPVDGSPPGSSVHGILQARTLEGVAFPSSRNLSNPGIEPRSSALQADSLPSEPWGKPDQCDMMWDILWFGCFLSLPLRKFPDVLPDKCLWLKELLSGWLQRLCHWITQPACAAHMESAGRLTADGRHAGRTEEASRTDCFQFHAASTYLTPVTSKVLSGRLILAHLLLWRTLIIDFYTGRTRAERLPHPGGTPLPPTLALILVEINVIWQTVVESPLLYDQDTSLLINPSHLNNGKSGKNNSVPQYSIRLCRSY